MTIADFQTLLSIYFVPFGGLFVYPNAHNYRPKSYKHYFHFNNIKTIANERYLSFISKFSIQESESFGSIPAQCTFSQAAHLENA